MGGSAISHNLFVHSLSLGFTELEWEFFTPAIIFYSANKYTSNNQEKGMEKTKCGDIQLG
ncbi:unnamed protein product [Staurois parvus]|uniref:Uncharacterized protein n=1 Tax=Staurois parvus TaxID=386267 RepID=A0ABN9BQB6_9NEOB|nr:unnamed protein product [Staurois parvus]